jgi:glycosyltransferase involved in cell wall biosynthesis
VQGTGGDVRMSVVIPAYNEGGYLEGALSSLQGQDFAGAYEVIVVDNNSTDDTAEIARRHGARVLSEPQPGVCAARQRGTSEARGDIVVSTDADTQHPSDWLTRLEAQFRARPDIVAVAGPCVYADPPWWAAVFPRLWFAAIGLSYAWFGRIFYLTATNLAFVRAGFPGYDTTLTQGGDEADVLRRLRRRGPVVWDRANPVLTSSRRMDQGLLYTLVVSFGYYYFLSYVLNRITSRTVLGVAPAIRRHHAEQVRRRRLRWRAGLAVVASGLVGLALVRSDLTVHASRLVQLFMPM